MKSMVFIMVCCRWLLLQPLPLKDLTKLSGHCIQRAERTTIPLTFGKNKVELLFKSPSNTEALLIQTCFKDLLYINRSISRPTGDRQESGRSSSGFISWLNFRCGAIVSPGTGTAGGRGHRSLHSAGFHFLRWLRGINQQRLCKERKLTVWAQNPS